MSKHTFTFMGTAAGCGVPAFFCTCPACEEARENPQYRRGDCGVMIRGDKTLIIDTPPDARHQLLREGITDVDQILFTHCHFDHIGGLGEYEYMVHLRRGGEPLPVYGSQRALTGILQEFSYMDYCLDINFLEAGQTITYDGVNYTGLEVAHAPGTFGYLIETPNTRLFYASDTATLPEATAEKLRGIDIIALDATYWQQNWHPNAHHTIDECIEECLALDAKKIYLTHLCMHYSEPITQKELDEYLKQYEGRVVAALDGMSFEI